MKNGLLGGLIALAAVPAMAQNAPKPACDRACLEGFVERYLDAMRDQKVSDDLFARSVKFTENGIQMPLGKEGLWFNMNGEGSYKFYVPDTETQQVAFLGNVRFGGQTLTDGTLAGIALRLRIADGRITEVEQLVMRPDNTQQVTNGGNAPAAPSRFPPLGEAVERMGKPHAIYSEVIPENKRHTRAELITVGNYYFSGLQQNDGKGYYPFTDDCVRFENGMDVLAGRPDANGNVTRTKCKTQFEQSLKGVVSRVRDRRFVAVDRERGIVFAFGFFDHDRINWTWQLAELFKVENGLIRRIEALFLRAPYGINSGWSTFEQGWSDQPQDVR